MTIHYIIQSVFVFIGLLTILAAIFNWEWLFTAHNSQFIVKSIGRNKARIFYAIIGAAMIAAGIYFYISVSENIH